MRACWLGILIAVVAAFASVPEARACGCGDDRPWDEVASSDVLFLGRLVKAEWAHTPEIAPWIKIPLNWSRVFEPNSTHMVFEVERWWRGSGRRHVRVITDFSSCSLPVPPVGEEMLIEAITYRGGIFTGACARSVPVYPQVLIPYMTGDPAYEYDRLLTRDSLRVHLGAGFEPTGVPRARMVVVPLMIVLGILVWRRRTSV